MKMRESHRPCESLSRGWYCVRCQATMPLCLQRLPTCCTLRVIIHNSKAKLYLTTCCVAVPTRVVRPVDNSTSGSTGTVITAAPHWLPVAWLHSVVENDGSVLCIDCRHYAARVLRSTPVRTLKAVAYEPPCSVLYFFYNNNTLHHSLDVSWEFYGRFLRDDLYSVSMGQI